MAPMCWLTRSHCGHARPEYPSVKIPASVRLQDSDGQAPTNTIAIKEDNDAKQREPLSQRQP